MPATLNAKLVRSLFKVSPPAPVAPVKTSESLLTGSALQFPAKFHTLLVPPLQIGAAPWASCGVRQNPISAAMDAARMPRRRPDLRFLRFVRRETMVALLVFMAADWLGESWGAGESAEFCWVERGLLCELAPEVRDCHARSLPPPAFAGPCDCAASVQLRHLACLIRFCCQPSTRKFHRKRCQSGG